MSLSGLQREIAPHYERGLERQRLLGGPSQLEFARTQEILLRYLPRPPATILDLGGGPGAYALWLARLGYRVHLIDLMPLHIQQAQQASDAQPDHPLERCVVGDARSLDVDDQSVDAALVLGPLYHLIERSDRVQVWREAARVVKRGGIVVAAAISRFASALDGLARNLIDDPEFLSILEHDLAEGQHRNPGNHPDYFTTAYLHLPEELPDEIAEAGLKHEATVGVEGPAWLLHDFEQRWASPTRRERLINVVRAIEAEPSMLGVNAHVLAIARR
jgi:SAM-dependent methyltransferase